MIRNRISLPILLFALASCGGGNIDAISTGPGEGEPSAAMTAAVPSAPLDLTAVWADPAAPVVHLSWTDTSSDENGFVVERKVEGLLPSAYRQVAELPADTETWTDSEASISAAAHSYRVLARNAAGNSPFGPEISLPSPLPAAPSALCGKAAETSVTLNWHDNSDNEKGFIILSELLGTTYSVNADVTSTTIGGLARNTIYLFQVRAFNAFGESSPSNHLTILTSSGGCGG